MLTAGRNTPCSARLSIDQMLGASAVKLSPANHGSSLSSSCLGRSGRTHTHTLTLALDLDLQAGASSSALIHVTLATFCYYPRSTCWEILASHAVLLPAPLAASFPCPAVSVDILLFPFLFPQGWAYPLPFLSCNILPASFGFVLVLDITSYTKAGLFTQIASQP